MADQAYGIGNFQCGPDEAVSLELEVPHCHHWSVSLASYYWESIDYATRQTSLNGHQSVLAADGVFRIQHADLPSGENFREVGVFSQGTLEVTGVGATATASGQET